MKKINPLFIIVALALLFAVFLFLKNKKPAAPAAPAALPGVPTPMVVVPAAAAVADKKEGYCARCGMN